MALQGGRCRCRARQQRDGTVATLGDDSLICTRRRRRRNGGSSSTFATVAAVLSPRRLALILLACSSLSWRSSPPSLAHPSAPFFALAADVAAAGSPSILSESDDYEIPPPTASRVARKLKLVRKPGGAAAAAAAADAGVPPSNAKRAVNSALRNGGGGSTGASSSSVTSSPASANQTLSQILAKAGRKGLGGGIPGFVAGVVQVLTLMWLRTIINYQCRYGTTFRQAFNTLFNEGGVPRFYRGLGFALIQAPMARFVATAANDGVETLLASMDSTKSWGSGRGTAVSSIVVGLGRMALMPIDTCKTVLQVDSAEGFRNLMRKVKAGRIGLLYQGMFALAASSVVGYYPWFVTYNYLSKSAVVEEFFRAGLLRNAFIGFVASVVSDVVSNCIRVVKTTKQSLGANHAVSYGEVLNIILAHDGWKGLFGRGLQTRIFANALQSVMFTIVWRGLADRWSGDGSGSSGEGGDSNKDSSADDR